jgi:restriction system protein
LKAIEDGQTYRHRDVIDNLANVFNITYEERKELLPSGRQGIFDNRVGWARTYLKKAALIESPQRGSYYITQRGKDVISQNPSEITTRFLSQFPEFRNFTNPPDEGERPPNPDDKTEGTPEELVEYAYKKIKDNLAQEIIDKIKTCSPKFFENLVIDLLLRMGYGGSRKDAGQSMGKTGDGGIDGIIKEDKLGLDIIYIQAKRWEGQVPVKEIRDLLVHC